MPPRIPCLLALLCATLPLRAQSTATAATPPPSEDAAIRLDAFEVSGSANGYLNSETTSGTRYAEPINEIPFPVNVITSQFMEDFQTFDLSGQAALVYTSSFSNSSAESSTGVIVLRGIRGFAVYKNGIREAGVYGPAAIDRIEVVKGASASIYGQSEPSGAVNRVTKEGTPNAFQTLTVSAGDDQYSRTLVDVNQPVNDKLFTRFAASYENSEQYEQIFQKFWRENFYGSLTYRFTPENVFTIHSDNIKFDSTAQSAGAMPFVITPVTLNGVATTQVTGILGQGPYEHFRHLNINGPYTHNEVSVDQTDFNFVHTQKDWLTIMVLGSYWHRVQQNPTSKTAGTNAGSYNSATGQLLGTTSYEIQANKSVQYNAQANFLAHFITGPFEHKLLFTADYLRGWTMDNLGATSTRADASIPLENFISGGPYSSPTFPYGTDFGDTAVWNKLATDAQSGNATKGMMLSERLGFWKDRVLLTLGARHDQLDASQVNFLGSTTLSTNGAVIPAGQIIDYPEAKKNTVQSGLVVKLAPQLALFADYSTAFVPQGSNPPLDINGNPLPPVFGKSTDAGFKGDFLEHKLTFTTDFFDLTRANLATTALNNLGQSIQVPGVVPGTTRTYSTANTVRSYGAEFDGTYNFNSQLTLLGGIGWDHIRYVAVPNATQQYLLGIPPDSTPAWTAGLAIMDHLTGIFQGFYWRLGVHGQTRTLINTSTTSIYGNSNIAGPVLVEGGQNFTTHYFENPGFALFAVGAGYSWKSHRFTQKVSLNIDNLFDHLYLVGANIQNGISGNITFNLLH